MVYFLLVSTSNRHQLDEWVNGRMTEGCYYACVVFNVWMDDWRSVHAVWRLRTATGAITLSNAVYLLCNLLLA